MSPTQKNQFSIKTLNEHSLGPGPFHGQSKFFIPMNLREQRTNHWSLVLVDILTKKVIVYDSLNPTEVTPEVSGNISKFLNCIIERPGIGLENYPENNDEIEVIYDPLVENANFEFIIEDTVRQPDSSSCGIYLILNLLQQINIIDFKLENDSSFVKLIKDIMIHDYLSFNEGGGFSMGILAEPVNNL